MNAAPETPRSAPLHQRRIHYIDFKLQKRLLIALVVMELVVLCIAGAILYYRLNAIVDENLYRVHIADQPSMFFILFTEALQIIGGLVAVNLAALLAADRIWAHYVRGIMDSLRHLLNKSRTLDFSPDDEDPLQHPVIELALAWRGKERALQLGLHGLAQQAGKAAATGDLARYRETLRRMEVLLLRVDDDVKTQPTPD
jgi:hypothetical protein